MHLHKTVLAHLELTLYDFSINMLLLKSGFVKILLYKFQIEALMKNLFTDEDEKLIIEFFDDMIKELEDYVK